MAIDNAAYDRGDESSTSVEKREPDKNSAGIDNQPDEGTLLHGHQTYFADEKVEIPDIDKVCILVQYYHYRALLDNINPLIVGDLNVILNQND